MILSVYYIGLSSPSLKFSQSVDQFFIRRALWRVQKGDGRQSQKLMIIPGILCEINFFAFFHVVRARAIIAHLLGMEQTENI